MDELLKIILISMAVALGMFVIIGVMEGVAGNTREIQFRETIKNMDNRSACAYQCSHEWGSTETHEQYRDCLNYCEGGKNNG